MNEYNNPLSFGTTENVNYYASHYAFAYDAFERLYKTFPLGYVQLAVFLNKNSGFDIQLIRRVLTRFKTDGLNLIMIKDGGCPKHFFHIEWSDPRQGEETILLVSKLCHAVAYTDIQLTTIRAAYQAWRRDKLLNYLAIKDE